MQNPQVMNDWMNTLMSNPQSNATNASNDDDNPEHMRQMLKMMQNMTDVIDHNRMNPMMGNNQ